MRGLVVIAFATGAVSASCGSTATAPQPRPEPQPFVPTVAPTSPGVELPEVASIGFAAADSVVATISVSPTAFTVAGKQVLALRDGKLADGDEAKLAGAIGIDVASAVPAVTLAFDRRVPVATLTRAIRVLSERGAKQFQLLARSGAGQVGAMFQRAAPAEPPKTLEHTHPITKVQHLLDISFIPELRTCHEQEQKRAGKPISGRLVVQFVVTPTGKFTRPKLTGLDVPALHECMKGRIAKWEIDEDEAPNRELGFALQFDVPSWRAFDPNPASKPPGKGYRTEMQNGKQVFVVDTLIEVDEAMLLTCTITDKHFRIGSHSGAHKPQGKADQMIDRTSKSAFTELADTLLEIVKRNWWHGRQFEIDDEIAIEVTDPDAQIQLLAETFGAVRYDADGFPLFPELRLVVK